MNGQTYLVVSSYPTTIEVGVTIINEHSSSESVATRISSALFPETPPFQTPLAVPNGGSVTATFSITVNSQEECEALAAKLLDPTHLQTTVDVLFDLGEAQCSAELVCESTVCR